MSYCMSKIITQSQTVQTIQPITEKFPGVIGINSSFQGYPSDNHAFREI